MFKFDIYHNWHFERKNTDSELGLSKTLTNVNVVDRHLHVWVCVSVCVCIVIFGCKNYLLLFFLLVWINNVADIEKKHVSWFVMLKVALFNNGFSSCSCEIELEQFKMIILHQLSAFYWKWKCIDLLPSLMFSDYVGLPLLIMRKSNRHVLEKFLYYFLFCRYLLQLFFHLGYLRLAKLVVNSWILLFNSS